MLSIDDSPGRKRPKTTPSSQLLDKPAQQLVCAAVDSSPWFPPSPQNTSRRRKRGEESWEYGVDRSSRSAAAKKIRLSEEGCAWDTTEDWITQHTTPEQIAAIKAQPIVVERFITMDGPGPGGLKRGSTQSSSKSYSQAVRDGELPRQHSHQHEANMRKFGMIMGPQFSATINEPSKLLRTNLLAASLALPPWFPHRRVFMEIIETFRLRSEASIQKTIGRYILPSPEVLHLEGFMDFKHITESNDVLWAKCATLHGTTPKPDTAIGIHESAFSEAEMKRLEYHSTVDTPTRFSEEMFFPFVIYEAKSIATDIQESERQAMHGASIAIKAIVELYKRAQLDSFEDELNGQFLVFSVSHNHAAVKIFGHFPRFNGGQVTYHRDSLLEMYLGANNTEDEWTRPYKFFLAVYKHHFPLHLTRIRSVLSKHREPSMESFTVQLAIDGSQDAATSSQERGAFKRPKHPSLSSQTHDSSLQGRISALVEELREQRLQFEKQRQDLEKQRQDLKEQLEQQGKIIEHLLQK